jgi:DNA-binding Xre family transcriptional regulator
MNAQTIVTPSGERLVMLPEADYRALLAALEEVADAAAAREALAKLASGEEELVPAAVVDRLLAGENRIKVWREHRGLTISELAAAAGLSQPYVSQIESGARKGGRKALGVLAKALGVEAGDLAGV